ncbi:MAG: hypothetical protein JW920_09050 [Deltaproteobacteria bacterium]|nr:hypothetical protein [Deltaproteobacteria bacterium]
MKINFTVNHFLFLMKDLLDTLEALLEKKDLTKETVLEWKTIVHKLLLKMFGENHDYVTNFSSIDFQTPFINDADKILLEETYRLGLEDAKSFLISLIDEIESEHLSIPGLMDMESIFAEMGRYISAHVDDPLRKTRLFHRITCLREGMISGDISGKELKNHITDIGYLDSGLFERIVPLLAWYYLQKDSLDWDYNN